MSGLLWSREGLGNFWDTEIKLRPLQFQQKSLFEFIT
jgi:hypothetical protein